MTADEQKKYEKKKHTIWGDETEKKAFSNFTNILSEGKYKDAKIFSLNGIEYLFPNYDKSKEKTGEFDQIFVMDIAKIVVYVEYKRTFSAAHAKKKRQFEHFREFFESNFPSGEDWKLVTCYGFTKWPQQGNSLSALRPCPDCMPYVFMINDLREMRNWLDSLLSSHKKSGITNKALYILILNFNTP